MLGEGTVVGFNLEGKLDRLMYIAKLIEAHVEPKLREDEIISLDIAVREYVDTYKQLDKTHPLRRKFPDISEILQANGDIQKYFNNTQIEYSMEALTDMYNRFSSIKPGEKLSLGDDLNEFRIALNLFRRFVREHRRNDPVYNLALRILEETYTKIENAAQPVTVIEQMHELVQSTN